MLARIGQSKKLNHDLGDGAGHMKTRGNSSLADAPNVLLPIRLPPARTTKLKMYNAIFEVSALPIALD